MFKFIIIFTFILLFLIITFDILTRKYVDSNPLVIIFGCKGSGKSTYIVKHCLDDIKHGFIPYTNLNVNIPGVRVFNVYDFLSGKFTFPPGSHVYVDEISVYMDGRSWKNTQKDFVTLLRYQRHEGFKCTFFSQGWDMEVAIKRLCSEIYIQRKFLRVFSYLKRVNKYQDIKSAKESADSTASIVEELQIDPIFYKGAREFIFIPRYSKYHDSFAKLGLDQLPYCEVLPQISPESRL